MSHYGYNYIMQKIERIKFRCWWCKAILWSEVAIQRHLQNKYHYEYTDEKKSKDRIKRFKELAALGKEDQCFLGYEAFYEPEFCPFVYPNEKVICSCVPHPQSVNLYGIVLCPVMIDRPELIRKYKTIKIEPGIYEGKVEQMELVNERLRFVFATRDKRFSLESSKTTAFEFLKRMNPKELQKYSKNMNFSRIWDGFTFLVGHPIILRDVINKAIIENITFLVEIKEGCIIGKIRKPHETQTTE